MQDNIIQFPQFAAAIMKTRSPKDKTPAAVIPFPNANTNKPKRKAITLERVIDMASRQDCEGICLACGEDAQGVEPDAREYTCESCGAARVYGAEELVFMVQD